jgi:preprotein translocase subunit SecB
MSEQNAVQIGIAKIYVKDISFESPMAPMIFRENWRPEIKLDVTVTPRHVQESLFEVALEITVEAREGDDVGFLVEIEQAGLFEVKVPEGPQLDRILRVFCPSTLFPYARQAIDQALLQGGFPPLMLAPVNFENMQARTN